MIIAGMADIHGFLSHSVPECDVLALVGDTMPLLSSAEDWKSWQEYDWVDGKLMKWLKRQPAKHILIVPGNHDICMFDPTTRDDTRELLESDPRVVVLDTIVREHVTIDGIKFAGYPYTPTIQQRKWAFSQARSSQAVKLGLDCLPTDADVLLTHGPPAGILDSPERYGCSQLAQWVIEHGPRLTLTGHIHEERGRRMKYFDKHGRVRSAGNVSICDAAYNVKGAKVQTFEIGPLGETRS